MNIFEQIAQRAKIAGLGYVFVGGHAVIAHGFARLTFDVDVLIPEAQAEAWSEWFLSLGYTRRYRSTNFLQLNAPEGVAPVDLMYADAASFAKLEAEAETLELAGVKVKIAQPKHLIAMKYRRPEDAGKDWDDIVALIRIRKLDLNDPAIEDIFRHYGGNETLARFHSLRARQQGEREADDRRS